MQNAKSYSAFLQSPQPSLKVNSYFKVYDELFSKFIDKKITFVEIGVLDGGSLFMWRDFFGKEARIIGIDLNPDARKWEAFGFEIFIGNQNDPKFWKRFTEAVGDVDVVLDDGGHTYYQQINTVESLLPHIKSGGLIVVEDTHTSYMRGFGFKKLSFTNYIKRRIDRINYRYNGINGENPEHRISSIQCFTSIVALHVDKDSQMSTSKEIVNVERHKFAEDYRYKDVVTNMQSHNSQIFMFIKRLKATIIPSRIYDTFVQLIFRLNALYLSSKTRKFF